jgi:hypothetical protein
MRAHYDDLSFLIEGIMEHNYAWLAGILDGDGSIGAYKTGKSAGGYQIRLRLVLSHKPTAEWAAETFGGHIYEHRGGTKRQHCVWYVSWSNANALALIEKILPYSRLKRPQYDVALQWPSVGKGVALEPAHIIMRRDIVTELKRLKFVGMEKVDG